MARTARETVESVVIAFVLAFLFRTFEAEAFVIPTGSMAPTLQGRHKDLKCPKCGYWYKAGASSEADPNGRELGEPYKIGTVVCPICRYPASTDPQTEQGRKYPSYSGDRILVDKFPYEFGEPERWDVIVFKYPGDAKVNYIKRLVGLPNETVRIYHGDIYTKGPDETDFELRRRSPKKIRAMLQMVYDNDYVVDEMTEKGCPLRWQPGPQPNQRAEESWTTADRGRSYQTDGAAPGETWIRYRHFVPSRADWKQMKEGTLRDPSAAGPKLITDFYAYNTGVFVDRGNPNPQREAGNGPGNSLGLHWVGDLAVECELDVHGASGNALLDLVKGGRHLRCALDVATGQAHFSIDGLPDFHPTAQTAVRGPGTYKLLLANVDNQLLLWVNDSVVEFDTGTVYPLLDNDRPVSDKRDEGDLAPVGIGSVGVALKTNHLRVLRDIYYIADRYIANPNSAYAGELISEYRGPTGDRMARMGADEHARFFSSPELWRTTSVFDDRQPVMFSLAADQFFALGDNSPASKDSRLWEEEHYVRRDLLIGKALFVYWPHSFERLPGTTIPFPFFPNFEGMGFVR